MKTRKNENKRKKGFLITLMLLLVFAVIGQIGIDKISLESERGQYWEYESHLHYLGITIAITCAAIGLFFLVVRFFPVKKKLLKIIAWVLGIVLSSWMLFCSGNSIYRSFDSGDVYGVAGLWLAYVDRLEEEQKVWNKSHWFGRGEEIYEYSYDEFTEAHSHLSLGNEDEEPYHSMLEERYKMEAVFQYCESDTMINVLSYFYGKWVWLIYGLLDICTVVLGASMLPLAGRLPGKIMFLAAWILLCVTVTLPALNGCALVFDLIGGPLFTGTDSYYWLFGALTGGPAIGVMLGLVFRKNKTPLETLNVKTCSATDEDKMSDSAAENADPAVDTIKYPEDEKTTGILETVANTSEFSEGRG